MGHLWSGSNKMCGTNFVSLGVNDILSESEFMWLYKNIFYKKYTPLVSLLAILKAVEHRTMCMNKVKILSSGVIQPLPYSMCMKWCLD